MFMGLTTTISKYELIADGQRGAQTLELRSERGREGGRAAAYTVPVNDAAGTHAAQAAAQNLLPTPLQQLNLKVP